MKRSGTLPLLIWWCSNSGTGSRGTSEGGKAVVTYGSWAKTKKQAFGSFLETVALVHMYSEAVITWKAFHILVACIAAGYQVKKPWVGLVWIMLLWVPSTQVFVIACIRAEGKTPKSFSHVCFLCYYLAVSHGHGRVTCRDELLRLVISAFIESWGMTMMAVLNEPLLRETDPTPITCRVSLCQLYGSTSMRYA